MVKTLSPIGKDLALIIDPTLLDELGIGRDTPLEIRVDGKALVIRAADPDVQARFLESARRMMTIHHETFRKLAE